MNGDDADDDDDDADGASPPAVVEDDDDAAVDDDMAKVDCRAVSSDGRNAKEEAVGPLKRRVTTDRGKERIVFFTAV